MCVVLAQKSGKTSRKIFAPCTPIIKKRIIRKLLKISIVVLCLLMINFVHTIKPLNIFTNFYTSGDKSMRTVNTVNLFKPED